jgi:hypothetical protein
VQANLEKKGKVKYCVRELSGVEVPWV